MVDNEIYLAKIIKIDNKNYLYDALYNNIIVIPQSIADNKGVNNDIYSDFAKIKKMRDFTKPVKFEIKYPYTYSELFELMSNRMSNITLSLTENCNLRCKYCGYMPRYLQVPCNLKNLDESTLLKSVNMLMKSSCIGKESIYISFYGGEPLLKFDLIKKCVEYCKTIYPFTKVNFYITTNGLLLGDKDIIEFIVKNYFHLAISLDGPRNIHDKYRLQSNGQTSFDKIFKNIVKLYKYDPKFFKTHISFNSVITPTTGTFDQYEFLNNLCKTDILLIDCNVTDYFSKIIETERNPAEEEIKKAQRHVLLRKSLLKNMQKYHYAFSNPTYQNKILPGGFCIPGVRKNFITVDGKIYVCEKLNESEDIYQIGDVHNGIDINRIKNLIDKAIEKTQKCESCWAAKFCNICFKDIFALTDEFCEKSRNRIKNDIIYYLEHIITDKKLTNYLENLSVE